MPLCYLFFIRLLRSVKDLGVCNALTNQEAKVVLKRFAEANSKTFKTWRPTDHAAKALDYLERVEARTDLSNADTVSRLRE